MSTSRGQGAMVVNNKALLTVIALWWLCSLIVVRLLLELPFVVPLLEAVREAIPAVQKAARGSATPLAITAFYVFFILTTPIVARWYSRYTRLTQPLETPVMVIMWLLIAGWAFYMTIGIDISEVRSPGFRRTFYLVLNSSWFGSSFIFLLFCHCMVFAAVCLFRNKGRRIS
jgi:hypothetical protein